jgi:tripartite-type tricarboxylate transporter receptor subunit TctC
MEIPMKTLMRACAVLLAALMFAGAAGAQQYPSKPIRFIVPFTPGGSQDVIARIFAQKLAESLGQQVVVDNRGGAAGLIAAETVAKAPRDGYTMLLATGGQISLAPALHPKLAYDPVRDFTSVGQIADQAMSLIVNNAVPAKSVAELVAYAKGKSLNYASTGNGTISHLTMEAFKLATGISAAHVPYKGAGPALIDLLSGQVQMMFTGVPSAQPFVSNGKVRMLAVASRKRSPVFPDVPTLIESGYKDFVSTVWIGVLVPAGTPEPIVKTLNTAFRNALKQPDLLERLAGVGAEPAGSTPAEFDAVIKADIARWAKVVKATGVKLD